MILHVPSIYTTTYLQGWTFCNHILLQSRIFIQDNYTIFGSLPRNWYKFANTEKTPARLQPLSIQCFISWRHWCCNWDGTTGTWYTALYSLCDSRSMWFFCKKKVKLPSYVTFELLSQCKQLWNIKYAQDICAISLVFFYQLIPLAFQWWDMTEKLLVGIVLL